jgi:hypothetical protein
MCRASARSVTTTSSSPRITVIRPALTSVTYATTGSGLAFEREDVVSDVPLVAAAGPALVSATAPSAAVPVPVRKVLRV